MDSKSPLQPKPVRRKVNVVYYLSRGGGQMDHPHLLEGYVLSAQDSLRLRDFKKWLAVLRGKSMPGSYAWSCKRAYKNGFIWHDLGENDLIHPLSKNEYVLMGSERKEVEANTAKCKCGAIRQQTESKLVAEISDKIQETVPVNKSILRSPKVITKSSLHETQGHHLEGLPDIICSPARLAMLAQGNKFHGSTAARILSKSNVCQGSALSKSFNDLTTQTLIEQMKKSTSHCDAKPVTPLIFTDRISRPVTPIKLADRRSLGTNTQASLEERNIFIEDYIQNETDDVDEHPKDSTSDGGNDIEDDMNGTYVMEAVAQTCESNQGPTKHNHSTDYTNIADFVASPGVSARQTTLQRISSARFYAHTHGSMAKENVPVQFSQEFSTLPNTEKPNMIKQSRNIIEAQNACHVLSSNHTSLHNHMGSPGALSSSSAMSAASNARLARKEGHHIPAGAMKNRKPSHQKPEDQHHHRHRHTKGTSGQYLVNGNPTSASNNLLRQLLKCGDADVVSEKKPHSKITNSMIENNNALLGLQKPSNTAAAVGYGKTKWTVRKPGALMKKVSSNASSDNRSVVSATASERGSTKETMEITSSPESVYMTSSRHLKRDMVRAHTLATSSASAAIRSQEGSVVPAEGPKAASFGSREQVYEPQQSAAGGSRSPGVLSMGSSASRRSSIEKPELAMVVGGNVHKGLCEALENHQVKTKVNSKARSNGSNKNVPLRNEILNQNDLSSSNENLVHGKCNGKQGPSDIQSNLVSELHMLICNPSGTPTYDDRNRLTTTDALAIEQGRNNCKPHPQTREIDNYTMPPKSYPMLIPTHASTRIQARPSMSPTIDIPSKSTKFPSSLPIDAQHTTYPCSHVSSSWKELMWSPPQNSSFQREKEKRHMKP